MSSFWLFNLAFLRLGHGCREESADWRGYSVRTSWVRGGSGPTHLVDMDKDAMNTASSFSLASGCTNNQGQMDRGQICSGKQETEGRGRPESSVISWISVGPVSCERQGGLGLTFGLNLLC